MAIKTLVLKSMMDDLRTMAHASIVTNSKSGGTVQKSVAGHRSHIGLSLLSQELFIITFIIHIDFSMEHDGVKKITGTR